MKLELIRSRVLTDEEIHEIEEQRRIDALLSEIYQVEIYRNRDNPSFSRLQITRRRLLEIAAFATSAAIIADFRVAHAYEPSALSDVAPGATLAARFVSPQPILSSSVVAPGENLSVEAKVKSTVDYEQSNNTIGSVLYSRNNGVEDTRYFPHELPAFTENVFGCDIDISPKIFGVKICILKTKFTYIHRSFNVRST